MLTRSLKQDAIIEVFGDFTPYLTAEGMPSSAWEREILQFIDLPAPLKLSFNPDVKVTKIRCHKLIAAPLKSALYELYENPSVWNSINDFGGVYQFRRQRKSKTALSRHCWGIAIDLDVADNPFGKDPKVDPKTVSIFEDHGFIWGGLFPVGRKDGMHFEFADLDKI